MGKTCFDLDLSVISTLSVIITDRVTFFYSICSNKMDYEPLSVIFS